MSKKMLVAVFVMAIAALVSGNVWAAQRLWAPHEPNPRTAVDPTRQPQPGDSVITLSSDLLLPTQVGSRGGNWEDFDGIAAGSTLVFPQVGMPWLVGCGNPFKGIALSDIPENGTPAPSSATSSPATATATANVSITVPATTSDDAVPQYQLQQPAQGLGCGNYQPGPGFFSQLLSTLQIGYAPGAGWYGSIGGGGYGGYGCCQQPYGPSCWYQPAYYPKQQPSYYQGGDTVIYKTVNKSWDFSTTYGGGGGPVNPPNPPGTGGGPVNPSNPGDPGSGGSGSGSGGGPSNPSSLVRRGNIAGQNRGVTAVNQATGQRFQIETANGRRVPLTSQEVRANFPHGPTMGNGAWNPTTQRYAPIVRGGGQPGTAPRQNAARGTQTPRGFAAPRATQPRQSAQAPHGPVGNWRQAPRIPTPQQRGGYANPSRGTQQQPRVMPRQQYQPRQYNPAAPQYRYRAPAYRPPVYRPAAPRFSAPQYRAPMYRPAPVFRGGGFRR